MREYYLSQRYYIQEYKWGLIREELKLMKIDRITITLRIIVTYTSSESEVKTNMKLNEDALGGQGNTLRETVLLFWVSFHWVLPPNLALRDMNMDPSSGKEIKKRWKRFGEMHAIMAIMDTKSGNTKVDDKMMTTKIQNSTSQDTWSTEENRWTKRMTNRKISNI